MTIPLFLLEELCRYLPALEASATLNAATAASVPHLKKDDRRIVLADLRAVAREMEPPAPAPEPMEKIELDKEKARQWFESQGVRVVSAG